ncbi:exo-alpha-sialidase [Prosthecobacter sp.]|uniref:exo-alpha-sialidase n=1 Tax=Prosthecobacter sp. TaxID=1965333 RepID=UPI003784FAE4
MKALFLLLATAGLCCGADFRIENSTVLTSTGAYHWSQSRAALIPGNPARVMVTTQEFEKQGSHGYRDIFSLETTDGAKTWTTPKRIDSLTRKMSPLGVEMVMGDLCPQWHAATRKVLVTGKTFGFRKDAKPSEAKDDRAYERVAYAIYSPEKNEWSDLKIMAMPEKDHAGHPIIEPNAGCNQRFDLPSGEVLLPVRYRTDPKLRTYTTIVARCTFDGETLTYHEHGSELTTAVPRGLYEPSVIGFKGRYFLTMRAEKTGYVARGTDGINYEPVVEWKFDDGKPVGTYCTQQHWIAHRDGLYLIYTRKGANNDHVFRHRAPIFIARVDPDKLHVIRATEQILMPETGVDLGGGYAPVNVSEKETWVISTEMAFPKNRQGENNRILLAKILWNQP